MVENNLLLDLVYKKIKISWIIIKKKQKNEINLFLKKASIAINKLLHELESALKSGHLYLFSKNLRRIEFLTTFNKIFVFMLLNKKQIQKKVINNKKKKVLQVCKNEKEVQYSTFMPKLGRPDSFILNSLKKVGMEIDRSIRIKSKLKYSSIFLEKIGILNGLIFTKLKSIAHQQQQNEDKRKANYPDSFLKKYMEGLMFLSGFTYFSCFLKTNIS